MKVLKYALYGVLGLIVLLVAALAILAVTFDPNAYKPQIQRFMKAHYDRDLTIGDMGLRLFPKLGARLTRVTLSEHGGSGEFAGVDEAQVSLALLPLLSRNVVVDAVHVDGLRARLVKHADGTTNFDDLTGARGPKQPPQSGTEQGAAPMRLDVDGIRVTRSQVVWKDEQANQEVTVLLNNFETGRLVEDKPARIDLDARLQGTSPKIDAHLSMTGALTFNLARQRFGFEGLDARVQGNALDFSDLAVQLKGDVAATGADKRVALSRLNVSAKGTRGNDRFDVTLAAPVLESSPQRLRVENLAVSGAASFGTTRLTSSSLKAPAVQMDLEKGQLLVQGLTMTAHGKQGADDLDVALSAPKLDVTREHASGESAVLRVKLAGAARNADVNLRLDGVEGSAQALRVAALTLEVDARAQDTAIKGRLATPVTGNLQAKVYELPRLDGNFTVSNPAFPRKTFQVPLSGLVRADLGKERVSADLKARFDESNIQAKGGMTGFAKPAYDFDVGIDRLNVDQYRNPQKSAGAPPGKGKPGPQGEAPIDLGALKTLDLDGTLKVGQLQVNSIKAGNLRIDVHAKAGRLTIDPLWANLYEGSTRGSIGVDANGNRFTIRQSMTGIEIGPLLRDVARKDVLEGKGNVALDLHAQGNVVSALERSLNGSARIALRDGAVKGVDLASAVRRVKATLTGKDAEGTASSQERTDFSELTASFDIRNGIAHNDDLSVKSPFLRVGGQGNVDIPDATLDYTVKTSVVGTMSGQGGKELTDLRGITVPVRVSGPFDQLHYKVEFSQMMRGATKEQLQAGKEALKGAARSKLQELLGGKAQEGPAQEGPAKEGAAAAPRKEKPEDKLKEKLKGLLR